ncbi:MAG TPA: hypothetical protein DEQ44_02335 [Flavobacteriaceae bacterium]|jgi:hypothetical protein|nr:hypothetical protein [Flavobacteriaceae bacterium]
MIGLLSMIPFWGIAQESEPVYSTQTKKNKEEKLGAFDRGEAAEINPLAPAKAAFFSAVLPGLGQAYNKKYWKIPMVYAALGSSLYGYLNSQSAYTEFRNAFKSRRAGFMTDKYYDLNNSGLVPGSPDISDSSLQKAQELAQDNRDLALVVTIGIYALNIIDANVDAHLKQFNVSQDLSFQWSPTLEKSGIDQQWYTGVQLSLRY